MPSYFDRPETVNRLHRDTSAQLERQQGKRIGGVVGHAARLRLPRQSQSAICEFRVDRLGKITWTASRGNQVQILTDPFEPQQYGVYTAPGVLEHQLLAPQSG